MVRREKKKQKMTSFETSTKTKTAEKIKKTNVTTKEHFKNLKTYEQTSDKMIRCTNQQETGHGLWQNGFVAAIFAAYCSHHNLELRPDDVWQAILAQFSLYVNANGETLRSKFVSHQGQKELTVYDTGNLYTADFGLLSKKMADEIQKHIVDPAIKDWATPNFTTTTDNDLVVAAISLMAITQKYFAFKMGLCCGIPKVTLHGTVDDWVKLQTKVQGLTRFDCDDHMNQWVSMLGPIMQEFVNSVSGNSNIEFWDRICHRSGGGSGPSYLSGWLAVFCVFDEEGKWQGDPCGETKIRGMCPSVVQGYGWPIVDTDDICSGVVEVPVTVDDNGQVYKTYMYAGQVCASYIDDYTLAPRSDWVMSIAKQQ